ncbi:MAG: hypothetical protein ACPL3S_03980 [Halothiobacillaceae bacterium]
MLLGYLLGRVIALGDDLRAVREDVAILRGAQASAPACANQRLNALFALGHPAPNGKR